MKNKIDFVYENKHGKKSAWEFRRLERQLLRKWANKKLKRLYGVSSIFRYCEKIKERNILH